MTDDAAAGMNLKEFAAFDYAAIFDAPGAHMAADVNRQHLTRLFAAYDSSDQHLRFQTKKEPALDVFITRAELERRRDEMLRRMVLDELGLMPESIDR